MGDVRPLLRGTALLAGAVAIVTAALFAGTLGYSLVACHDSSENPLVWALLMVLMIFLAVPVSSLLYVVAVAGVALGWRRMFARFGAPRVLGGLALLLVAIAATTAVGKVMAGASGGCSILGAAAVARFG